MRNDVSTESEAVSVVARPRRALALGLVLAATACASTSPAPAFRDLASTIHTRTGHALRWNQATADDAKIDEAVRALLARPLDSEGAVQVALLRNPAILATYEDLSIAQADLVQGGLLRNPVFSLSITTAERDALSPNLVLGVAQSFFDLLLLPARKKIAASQLEQAKFRIGNAVLDLEAQVRTAYYTVLGAEQTLAMRRVVADAELGAYELSRAQRDAGNVSDLTFMNEKALYQRLALEVTRGEGELASAREHLTRLMGLWGDATTWRTTGRLPDMPDTEASLDHLEARAVGERLDVASVRAQVQSLRYAVSLSSTSRWTGVLDVGADVARLKNGDIVVGPHVSIELPIFDQRRAVIARLEAQLRASEHLLAAAAIDARSEARDARNRVVYARQIVERFRTEIVPTQEQAVMLSQTQYDAMLLGVFQLVQAKQAEISAYSEYIGAVRDYWIARAELERSLGGHLVAGGSR